MKKWLTALILIIVFLLELDADEISKESQLALAFFAARDYEKANEIYERLAKQDLPDWQQALILYNLGTIQLAQNHPERALNLFQSISFNAISSPVLLRYIITNEGIAYLKRAELLNSSPDTNDIDDRIYLLHRSLESLEKADKIDCELQKFESNSLECSNSEDLQSYVRLVSFQLSQLQQQQREQLIQTITVSQSLMLLIEALQNFKSSLEIFSHSTLKPQDKLYLFHLGETLAPLWKNLEAQSINSPNEQVLKKAKDLYVNALNSLQQNFMGTRDLISQAIEILNQLQPSLSTTYPLEHLLLHYQILLTKDNLGAAMLQNLIQEQKKIQVDSAKQKPFDLSLKELTTSLEQLQAGHLSLARFFLSYSFYLLQSLSQIEENVHQPKEILEKALMQAKRSIQLNHLSQIEPVPSSIQKQVEAILKDSQTQTLKFAQPFIDQVLIEEKKRFQQIEVISVSRCQKKPWEQALPLFEKGYQEASLAQSLLSQNPLQNKQAILHQEQIIILWQQVLQLLEQPPESNENQESQSEKSQSNEATDQTNEVFRSLQEMQAEDTPIPQGPPKEVKGW